MTEARLSSADVRAAAEVHAELGPEYGDAVVESFLAKLDKQIEARVEERLSAVASRRPARPVDRVRLSKLRYALAGAAVAAAAVGLPLTLLAVKALAWENDGDGARVLVVWIPAVVLFGLAAYRLRRRG
jgi:hypothetical protein